MRLTALMMLIIMFGTDACTTTGAETGPVNAAPVATAPAKGETTVADQSKVDQNKALLASECPPKDTVCTMNYAPVVCSASTYEGKVQAQNVRLMVWANNSCSGRMRLNKEACGRSLVPSKLGSVQCVPDATGGHCPVLAAQCKNEVKPVTCFAGAYAGHALSEDQKLSADGQNECLARVELQMVACRANLDPVNLGGVECLSGSSKAGR